MRRFGDRRELAIEVAPLAGGPDEPDPCAAATWVELSLWVRGRNVTRHARQDDGAVHEGLKWPAIYLARWLIRSWSDLFEVSRWPVLLRARDASAAAAEWGRALAEGDDGDDALDARDRFVATHSLQSAAAGGIAPNLWLARELGTMRFTWATGPDDVPAGISFLDPVGDVEVPAGAFVATVAQFVAWIRDELAASAAAGALSDVVQLAAWLDDQRAPASAERLLLSFAGTRREELEPHLAVVGGLEAYFELPADWRAAGGAGDPTVSSIAVAYRCLAPRLAVDDLLAIRQAIVTSPPLPDASERLARFAARVSAPEPHAEDWARGQALAIGLRELLQNTDRFLDVDAQLATLGVPVTSIELSDPGVDAGCVCDTGHGPVVFVNASSRQSMTAWGRRMALAHELCHLLFDRAQGRPLSVISGPWAPARLERTANAFAAELLLPRRGIVRVSGATHAAGVTEQQRQQLMDEFGVGATVASWQISNRLGW